MSLSQLLMNELLDSYNSPLYDQHFGLGLRDDMFLPSNVRVLSVPLRSGYLRPWRNKEASRTGVSNIKSDQNGFKVHLDVQQFKPEEIKVKVVDNFVVIEGNHEEREDEHGFISRQFVRKYKLPDTADISALESRLSSDGVLMLTAPPKTAPAAASREIPITHTNAPAVKNKEPEKMEDN